MGNYLRVCQFEGEDVLVENKEKRNEEGKKIGEDVVKKDTSHQDYT